VARLGCGKRLPRATSASIGCLGRPGPVCDQWLSSNPNNRSPWSCAGIGYRTASRPAKRRRDFSRRDPAGADTPTRSDGAWCFCLLRHGRVMQRNKSLPITWSGSTGEKTDDLTYRFAGALCQNAGSSRTAREILGAGLESIRTALTLRTRGLYWLRRTVTESSSRLDAGVPGQGSGRTD